MSPQNWPFPGTVGGRAFLRVPRMFVSYVLRVRPQGLKEGRFTGEVEAVATGQRFTVRSVDELMAVVLETVGEEVALSRTARSGQEAGR